MNEINEVNELSPTPRISGERGKWAEPGVPHRGWVCVDFEDLEEPSAICEMCMFAEIRYVHVMRHADYPQALRCGCVCAENMEIDYTAARERERIAKNTAKRRAYWLKREWRCSANGNPYLNVDGFNVVIFRAGQMWKVRIAEQKTGQTVFWSNGCPLQRNAQLEAFDAVNDLKELDEVDGW